LADLRGTFEGYVLKAPEVRTIPGDYGDETRWNTNLGLTAGADWGTLCEVADKALADVLSANVGKKVRIEAIPNALPGGKRGAWLKLACSKVVPVP